MLQSYIRWKRMKKKWDTRQSWRHLIDLLSIGSSLDSYLLENILSISMIYSSIKILKSPNNSINILGVHCVPGSM